MPTEAQKRANYKYQEKKEIIRVWCDKRDKEKIKALAESAGKSVNQFMLDLALGEDRKKNKENE